MLPLTTHLSTVPTPDTAPRPSAHLHPHHFPQHPPRIQKAFYNYAFGLDDGIVRTSSPRGGLCRFKTLGTNTTTRLLLQSPLQRPQPQQTSALGWNTFACIADSVRDIRAGESNGVGRPLTSKGIMITAAARQVVIPQRIPPVMRHFRPSVWITQCWTTRQNTMEPRRDTASSGTPPASLCSRHSLIQCPFQNPKTFYQLWDGWRY